MSAPAAQRLARHAVLTFSGYAVPLVLAVLAIPIAARELGPVRFGLLGLAWALLEYLGFVELGLGRTSVRFVAQSLARSAADVRQTVAVVLSSQAVLGLVAAAAVAMAAPWLVRVVFDIPPALHTEATGMVYAVAANVVVVVLLGGLRGVLEGAERFGISTAAKIPTAAAAVLIPAIGAVAGASLGAILTWVLVVRLGAVLVLIVALPRAVSGFRWESPREWRRLRVLFAYSGWVAVSSVINPMLASFDRFVLGALVGVAALGIYAAPYEGAVRLLLLPTSVFAALFPTLSAQLASGGDHGRPARVLESALRQLTLVFTPVVVVLFAFAPEILSLWLGEYYAPQMATVFRILLIGVLANGLAHVPSVFLYAVGRPDLPAKIHIAELVVHVPITLLLVSAFGITGAAVAWTLRVLVDASLLSVLALRTGADRGLHSVARRWAVTAGALTALAAAAWVGSLDGARLLGGILLSVGLLGFLAIGWRGGLSPDERSAWLRLLPRVQGRNHRIS